MGIVDYVVQPFVLHLLKSASLVGIVSLVTNFVEIQAFMNGLQGAQ